MDDGKRIRDIESNCIYENVLVWLNTVLPQCPICPASSPLLTEWEAARLHDSKFLHDPDRPS